MMASAGWLEDADELIEGMVLSGAEKVKEHAQMVDMLWMELAEVTGDYDYIAHSPNAIEAYENLAE